MEITAGLQTRSLPVQQAHEPADAEQRHNEPAEAVEPVTETFLIGFLSHQPEHDAANQSEDERGLKVIEAKFHLGLVFLTSGDLVRVHHG